LDLRVKKWWYASLNIIRVMKSRRMRWLNRVAHTVEMTNAYNILAGKSVEKRKLARARRRWEDNIRIDLREMSWEGVN